MSTGRFAKREREKAKRERADNKRARRESRRDEVPEAGPTPTRSQDDLLAAIQALHAAHENGEMSFEDFEQEKAELLAQLQI